MAIHNDEELAAVVARINDDLQQIQDYLGRDSHDDAKLRFPRGFIRPAETHRQQLPFVENEALRHNLAYALMLADVYSWLLTRTDLKGTCREMVIKAAIFLSGAIAESLLRESLDGEVGKRKSFRYRSQRLFENDVIDEKLKEELDWVWDTRNNMHFFMVTDREFSHYFEDDYHRAGNAVRALMERLREAVGSERSVAKG